MIRDNEIKKAKWPAATLGDLGSAFGGGLLGISYGIRTAVGALHWSEARRFWRSYLDCHQASGR